MYISNTGQGKIRIDGRRNRWVIFLLIRLPISNDFKTNIFPNPFRTESLIGDTNLFLDHESHSAETEIMIAESDARRKKFGWEAMLMMIKFGVEYLHCGSFFAKIGFSNEKSQKMFEKMQFDEISRSEIFQEITYERVCTKDWLDWLESIVEYSVGTYP